MNRPQFPAKLLALLCAGMLTLAACGGGSDDTQSTAGGAAAGGDAPAWCGADEIVLGMTDGFGGNSLSLIHI